jgi:hypothetical protein
MTAPARAPNGQRGFATAELAAGLPVIVLLLTAGLMAVSAATAQVRCLDVAREAALAEARGEAGGAVAAGRAPADARIEVTVSGSEVTARVVASVQPWGDWLPGLRVVGEATAAVEGDRVH